MQNYSELFGAIGKLNDSKYQHMIPSLICKFLVKVLPYNFCQMKVILHQENATSNIKQYT